ncbi:unnamed protein product [Adineta steineri]|uniref:Uncharacterized protein n=1 Tax=Adineta steineri TaxID=433720 RepID=A0A813Z3N3_9BILA|nr:unnamed protein product [Adineta steineri]CAF0893081.1 unnamed protein product [Adineta steineri]
MSFYGSNSMSFGAPDHASAQQRGDAAHIRQKDDNSGKTMLTSKERQFVNSVIHDKSTEHNPKFDSGLEKLKKKSGC